MSPPDTRRIMRLWKSRRRPPAMPRMRRGLVMMASAWDDRTFTRRPHDGSKPGDLLEQSGSGLHIHILVLLKRGDDRVIGQRAAVASGKHDFDFGRIHLLIAPRHDTHGSNVSAFVIEKENFPHVLPRSWLDARVQPPCIPLVCRLFPPYPADGRLRRAESRDPARHFFCHNRIPVSFSFRSC